MTTSGEPDRPGVSGLASVVLFSRRPDEAAGFYRALGVPLEGEDHGDGIVHLAADVGGIHLAVLAADEDEPEPQPQPQPQPQPPGADARPDPGWRTAGTTFVGVWVDSLDETEDALRRIGAPVLLAHQRCEWGCRVVVRDPDGRPVEVNQAGHCG